MRLLKALPHIAVSKQLRLLWRSEDERVSQMEENAHCPLPEKLSSPRILPFNEFFVCTPQYGAVLPPSGSGGQTRAGPSVSGPEPGDGQRGLVRVGLVRVGLAARSRRTAPNKRSASRARFLFNGQSNLGSSFIWTTTYRLDFASYVCNNIEF